jgi:hypothetical protein
MVDASFVGALFFRNRFSSPSPVRKERSRWLHDERGAWQGAMGCDPLLPKVLLPPNYDGCAAWRRRLEVMAEAGDQMRAFRGG